MDGQHLKGSDTLLKSPRQYFCHIYRSIWNEVSSTNSILVVSEILRLFVHILTPDEKYSLSVKASVERNQLKWIYVKIKKNFLNFFLQFQNLHKIWNTLKNKMTVSRQLFPKL